MSPGQNDENAENRKSTKGSPMQITPFQKRDRDKIERSPLKRSRLEFSPYSPMEDESPLKKPMLSRCSTFPSPAFSPQAATQQQLQQSKSITRGITVNLSKSLGSKASSVFNLFSKTEKKKNQTTTNVDPVESIDNSTLKASMLAMLLVHKTNYSLLKGLISGVNVLKLEELAGELYDFFNGHNQTKQLINFMIRYEVQQTVTNTTLFRESSCTTKIIGILFKTQGSDFLNKVLLPHIEDIVSNCKDYEVSLKELKKSTKF